MRRGRSAGVRRGTARLRVGVGALCSLDGLDAGVDAQTPCIASPVRVAGLPAIAHIAVANDYSCALDFQQALWCWGTNSGGLLGHDPAGDGKCNVPGEPERACSSKPQRVGAGAGVAPLKFVDVEISSERACGITHLGALVGWGDRYGAPLRELVASGVVQAVAAAGTGPCTVRSDTKTWCEGSPVAIARDDLDASDASDASEPPALLGAVEIHSNGPTTCVRRADGALWCLGTNRSGLLGNGTWDSEAHTGAVQVPAVTADTFAIGDLDVACALSR